LRNIDETPKAAEDEPLPPRANTDLQIESRCTALVLISNEELRKISHDSKRVIPRELLAGRKGPTREPALTAGMLESRSHAVILRSVTRVGRPCYFSPTVRVRPALVSCTHAPCRRDGFGKQIPEIQKQGLEHIGGGPSPLATTASTPHPQQCGAPSRVMPQLKSLSGRKLIRTSVLLRQAQQQGSKRVEPFPSSPYSFVPQQYPLPFMRLRRRRVRHPY